MAELKDNRELQALINIKESGFKYKERRIPKWRANYELYRDEVTINRLTQRQSVNLPIMKTTLRTLLKDVDDMPVIVFENLDNDKEAEVFQNEYWKWTLEQNNAEIQDIVDKKQDFFFGRTFDSMQIVDGKIKWEIEDPEDILVNRYMNPHDIHSSRELVHTHIFVPLSSLENDPDLDQKEVAELKEWFKSDLGIVKAQDNENSLQQKNQKMSDLGVQDIEDPVLGETYVELTRYHRFVDGETYNGKVLPDQIWVYIEAENQCILMKKPQEEIIGVTKDHYWRNHYPYNTWGDDIDKQDFWTDGISDIVRVPNQVANAWFSQEIERRTMSNFGMTFYDASLLQNGFFPNTFEPKPFGFYPIPGKPSESLHRVEIPMNDGNLESINFITGFIERATGATAPKQGVKTEGDTTKFEINAVLNEATERTQGLSKFYTKAWEQRATTFLKLIEAGSDKLDAVKIYKKGRNTDNIFAREIAPTDWMTKAGYRVRVWSQDEKKSKDTDSLTKLQLLQQAMMDNPKVNEIYKRKLAEFADLTPDEVTEIMDFEKQKLNMMGNGIMGMPPQQPGLPVAQPPMQA